MDDKDVGLVWAKNYPRSGEERDALQICRMICRLVRQKTKLVFSISSSSALQRVLDGCGISQAEFDEMEKLIIASHEWKRTGILPGVDD